MRARESGCTQQTAAAKAGISERSGRRIEKRTHQPKAGKAREWRTRADPLAAVWQSELVPLLEREPQLQATTLLEYLQQQHGDEYGPSVLRTLQRRVRQWKAISGPAKPVVFDLEHRPGELGLSDFTHFKQAEVTIKGKPFVHLLYHYRLAYSGWQYVQAIQGGESFVGLSEGLQNALAASGGCPVEHRTDSLSAAYRNLGGRTDSDLTQMYSRLCAHYHLKPTRNNRGIAHENGAIEASHGHFKNRLHQALLLRGSFDFASVGAYQQMIEQVIARMNQKNPSRFEEESAHLRPLPAYRYTDYEVLTVKVTTRSTITVRCITYTVPASLIGHRLTLHLHHDRLVGFIGTEPVMELQRLHVPSDSPLRRARCVNYRHVAESLRQKPRAFLNCTWQQELLPNEEYRQLWQQLCQQFDTYSAARLITEALYIAAVQENEAAVARYLREHLDDQTLTLSGLQARFCLNSPSDIPIVQVDQHDIAQYDQLLSYGDSTNNSKPIPQPAAQVPSPTPHEPAVAGAGAPSP